jgi:glycosyltransferase involved in cell wall biosynthesis
MPCYNEGKGIVNFIEEICKQFQGGGEFNIIVIDDHSNFASETELINLAKINDKIILIRNKRNLGHGPSTIIGLSHALKIKSDYIIATDGDGQFLASDLFRIYQELLKGNLIVEGVRSKRVEPFFRKVVTLFVRIIIFLRTHKLPKDGNTPLRGYSQMFLHTIIDELPKDSPIPNIIISTLTRKKEYIPIEIKVKSMPPRGKVKNGVTWNQRFDQLPSQKFVKFCFKSIKHYLNLG